MMFEEGSPLTRDRLIRDLDELFRDAVATTQYEAAAQLGELIARINGWIVERQVVRITRSEIDVPHLSGNDLSH